ncbi:hypothetical protein [Roseisolibacter agri]|uniref:VWFA domain-containing protein n=1 Tax=Roseisolibacter agri TaxID=2014610 RepID=A0AA37QAK3_9BACT|nr:hypothetical protein [Roseisolibacter agri]GLC27757.1 hypothetical protein rosag_42700 [Roseisolibacter agri]
MIPRIPLRPGQVAVLTSALVAALTGSACSTSRAESDVGAPDTTTSTASAVRPSRLYIVGVDVSGSLTPTRRQEGRDLVNSLVGQLTFGDRLTIVETYRSRSDSAGQWTDDAPMARNANAPSGNEKRRLAQFQQRARMMAEGFFEPDPARPVLSTDILALLQRASDYAHSARDRRTTLLLVSDMLNATHTLNMEKAGGIPDAGWVADAKSQGRLPDLKGVCVVVAGADVSSPRGIAAREFWRRYLTASGAEFDPARYRTLIADAADVGC